MTADQRRARLLRQLTRLREIEHRSAAVAAGSALAEATRRRNLADRADALVATYGLSAGLETGQELAAQRLAGQRMRVIARDANVQAQNASAVAENCSQQERQAKNRLDRLEDATDRLAASIGAEKQAPAEGKGQLARFLINHSANSRGE